MTFLYIAVTQNAADKILKTPYEVYDIYILAQEHLRNLSESEKSA